MGKELKNLTAVCMAAVMLVLSAAGCGETALNTSSSSDSAALSSVSEAKEAPVKEEATDIALPSENTVPDKEEEQDFASAEDRTDDEVPDISEISAVIDEYFDEEVSYGIEYDGKGEISESAGSDTETPENADRYAADTNNGDPTQADGNAPAQLTIEDIQAMNPGSTVIDIYTNQGYLSTLVGKYYEEKVTNVEEGVLSIQPIASLLGLSKGCEFFAAYSEKNKAGYSFYTYQQRYGGYTLKYATLRIIVDPDGYTAGLSCSFVPDIGTASQEPAISKEEAETIVREKFSDFDLTYYPEYTVRLAVPFRDYVYNCWVIYTDNPDATPSFDMPYLEHYVTTDGSYLTLVPTNDFASSNTEVFNHSGYFEGLETKEYTATFDLEDGTSRTVTVPVSYNPKDSKYYLIDPSRSIAVAQYYDFNYRNTVNFVTSDTIDGFSKNNLMAYANYIIVYDFYLARGIRSVDGFGTPILITVGWCDRTRTPVNNACYYGINRGWACFGVSDINYYSDCVDVIGHEYTHGITKQSMQGVAYRNEAGSINESYSDIMGNLIEMSLDYTSDRSWLIAERTGSPGRDMGDPNRFGQPEYVGDAYYVPTVLYPDFDVNDYGGVHTNNSLVGHIAYLMDQEGMSYDEQISMWLTAVELITPLSDYQDLHGALLFSLKINNMLQKYGPALNMAFENAGLNENWKESYLTAARDGYGRVVFTTDENIAALPAFVFFADTEGKVVSVGYPDTKGRVSNLLPEGTYIAQLVIKDDDGYHFYNYTESGWIAGGRFLTFDITSGSQSELAGTSGQGY